MANRKKLTKIKPSGLFRMHTYLGDTQGCGHIRCIFPDLMLNQLRYKGVVFKTSSGQLYINDAKFYENTEVIKFQRPAQEEHLTLMMMALAASQKTKSGVLIEVDDLLTPDVPESNHAHGYYKKNWPYTKQMLGLTHGVICSTEPLADYYRKHARSVVVSKNRLAPWLWVQQDGESIAFPERAQGKPRILWAGSTNHFAQGESGGDFGGELIDFIRKTSDKYEWHLVGGRPHELVDDESIVFHEWQKILNFSHFLRSLEPDIGIAPLEPNFFNDCKSDIKVLEYCSLGIPGVYSDCFPYRGMSNVARSDAEMISMIEGLASDPELRASSWKADYDKVKDRLYWDDDSLMDYVNAHLKPFNKVFG